MKLSPAERQRRSDVAKRMHREGVLGSSAVAKAAGQRSGEVRQERASRIAQGVLERHAEEVEAALLAGLRSRSTSQRVKAAEVVVKLALSGQRQDAGEVRDVAEHRSREELLAILTDKLSNGSQSAALVRRALAERVETIDGTAVEAPSPSPAA